MAPMNFSTAEELDQQKNEISKQRIRKLTQDRQQHNGNSKLAQTDGLKPVRVSRNRNRGVVIDDQVYDLRRVRNLRDLTTDDEGIDE